MKQIFLIMIVVFFALQLKAQFIKDRWGDVVPFSLTEKYRIQINMEEIHSITLPSFDNDSLFLRDNNVRSYDELNPKYALAVGFNIDTLIYFQDYSTKVEIDEGTLWIMTIESATAQYLGVSIENLELPDSSYFTIYSATIPGVIVDTEVGFKEDVKNWLKGNTFEASLYDKKIVVEIFVPKTVLSEPNFILKKISYGYKGLGKPGDKMDFEKIKNGHNGGSSYQLKSGGHTKTPALYCQKDVACTEVASWAQEAKSVVFIQIPYTYDNVRYYSQGTGFFLNKSGTGFSDTDSPIIITCGHLFAPEVSSGLFDIRNNHGQIEVFVDYENESCNDDKTKYGKNIVGYSSINVPKVGTSFNMPSSYNPSQDFAILQPSKTIKKLAKYNIDYAAWNKDYDLSNNNNTGYAYLGHPSGDVKKVNIDNGRAYVNANGNEFGLYCDIGATQKGFSGGPVFSSNSQVVGWVCTKGNGALRPCDVIGDQTWENRTGCGRLSRLWSDIISYLDPTGVGSAPSSNPQPPTPDELPEDCSNCIQDNDETGIDCGGSCYPCGMQDVLAIKTDLELQGEKKSRYEIFAEPDPGSLLCLKSGSSSLEAGMNVYLNGGFEVQKGATFYAGIDAELMTEADRGCQPACVNLPNVFTPNGDGVNDYWAFAQAFVSSYDLLIWDRNNQTVYSVSNQTVYENGGIYAWDGAGAVNGQVYYGTLTYRDCYGNTHAQNFFTHVYKSATISSDLSSNYETEEPKVIEVEWPKTDNYIKVFPNPFTDKVNLQYSGTEFPVQYRITDLNGKVLLSKQINEQSEQVDLSNVPPGAYIINAKAGECNLVQKLIKK